MSEARADLPPPTPASSAMGLAPTPQPGGGNVALPRPNIGAAPDAPPAQPSLRDQVKAKWIAAGATPQAAEGIALAIDGESGFVPTKVGDLDPQTGQPTSFGLYQHHNDRALRLADFAKSQNKSPSDPLVQTDFAIKEATSGGDPMATQHRDSFMKASDPGVARRAFSEYFERPQSLGAMMMTPTGGSALRQRADALDREIADNAARDRDTYDRISKETAPGSKERDELLIEARQRAARAREMYEDIARHPPPEKPIDALQNFGSIGSMLALLIGGMGRHHMNGALAAAGAMMQAAQANNHEQFERQYKIWDHQSTVALNLGRLENDEIQNLLADKRMSQQERDARLLTFYNEHQMTYQAEQARAGMIDRAIASHERLEGILLNANNQKLQFAQMRLQSWLATPEGQRATEEQVDQKAAELGVSGGRGAGGGPRSALGMFMQEFKNEHPKAGSVELAEAAAEFRRQGALEVGFASGILGRQVISLNTVADHILRVKEYGEALRNGQIPLANRIANSIAVAEGKPEVVNFEAGRDIMADEVVRLLTSTGGTERDREGMQSHLASFRSPEQMSGLFGVFKEFTGARFEALRQQYAEGDPKREERFMKEKLTEKGREVFDSITKSKGPDTVVPPPPKPGDVMEGHRFKGGDPADPNNWEKVQ